MVVCQFWLKGTCRFGTNCKNEHPPLGGGGGRAGGGAVYNATPAAFAANNRFAILGGGNPGGNPGGGSGRASPTSAVSTYDDDIKQRTKDITNDFQTQSIEWPFSSFGFAGEPSIVTDTECSPEELRLMFYRSPPAQAIQTVAQLYARAQETMGKIAANPEATAQLSIMQMQRLGRTIGSVQPAAFPWPQQEQPQPVFGGDGFGGGAGGFLGAGAGGGMYAPAAAGPFAPAPAAPVAAPNPFAPGGGGMTAAPNAFGPPPAAPAALNPFGVPPPAAAAAPPNPFGLPPPPAMTAAPNPFALGAGVAAPNSFAQPQPPSQFQQQPQPGGAFNGQRAPHNPFALGAGGAGAPGFPSAPTVAAAGNPPQPKAAEPAAAAAVLRAPEGPAAGADPMAPFYAPRFELGSIPVQPPPLELR
ncbi:hypothetical protein BC828DRAFT_383256 [Blastocladiella britannica]|nr:hypothetical protein BC828DRAFT_383256 [Blastocladiella britannica]